MKLLIFQTSGLDTPHRLLSPFFIASTAVAMEMDATMVFTGRGITVLKKGAAEQVKVKEGGKSIYDFLKQAMDGGVKVIACQQGLDLVGMTTDDLMPEIHEIIGAAAFLDIVQDSDKILTF